MAKKKLPPSPPGMAWTREGLQAPAVFVSVPAGPEFEAECQELEKYKLTPDEEFNYDLLLARKRRIELEKAGLWESVQRRQQQLDKRRERDRKRK